ncbi:MAG: hypothetical protein M3R51_02690, partial [Candidatus Eremiobacteraeota bacterium]|nr:hypothetical protein [Candidatus Eremiobacteraeota bacterium]
YYTVLGTILDRQGDSEAANEAWVDARTLSSGIPAAGIKAELNYYVALSAWSSKDLDETESIAQESLAEHHSEPSNSATLPLAVSSAFTYELLSLVAGIRERYDTQVGFLQRGLAVLASLPERHIWAEASLLNNVASIIPEVRMPHIAQIVREYASQLPWTDEMPGWAYNVYRALGWSEALDGNEIAAFRDLRDAEAHAPSIPRRIEAILDRSFLFASIGEKISARERFDEAEQLCAKVDWNATEGEDRYALLWGAELAASFNPKRAAAMIRRYKAIRKPMNPLHAASSKLRRWQAYESDAFGIVACQNGELEVGVRHLQNALSVWDSLGFEWRAAKTARAIARLTKIDAHAADARRRASSYSQSWLGRPA